MSSIARFSDEWIEQVKSSVDIVSIVEKRVSLKPAGRNYVGLCPFHDEKTPSFTVNPEKQFFYCFGCGAGGNVINFVMRSESLSFPEAATHLARQVGIPVPAITPEQRIREEKRDALRKINHLAAQHFYRNLRGSFGQAARDYLAQRGLTESLMRSFYLGYSGRGWDELVRFFDSQGIDLEQVEEAGLIYSGKHGYVDRFRDRIIFPICDYLGRFIGFGGRLIGEGQPKYMNTPETLVFHKGQTFYGLNWAKDAIKEVDRGLVVEGYTDCISLSAKGQKNVVASLGTAFTKEHAQLLGRFTKNVIIAFDGDAAGEKATLRGLDILRQNGMNVKVAVLGSGQDPDTFARDHSTEEIENWLDQALPLMEYKIRKILSSYDIGTREGKLTASKEMISILAELENEVERDEYIRYAANRLRVDENALRADVGQSSKHSHQSESHIVTKSRYTIRSVRTNARSHDELVERDLLRWALYEPTLIDDLVKKGISADDFFVDEYRHLFVLLTSGSWDEPGAATASDLLSLDRPNGKWNEYLAKFRAILWRRRLQKIEEKLSSLENESKGFDVHMELYLLLKDYYDIRRTVFLSREKR